MDTPRDVGAEIRLGGSPSEDAYRALARSSPWRWRTLHLLRHGDVEHEAWIRRPADLLVREPDGRFHREHEDGGPSSVVSIAVAVPRPGVDAADLEAERAAAQAELDAELTVPVVDLDPPLRPDGLVAVRPDASMPGYTDLMYDDYRWTAMLDPVELAIGTEVDGVRAHERRGRTTWTARLRAAEGYDPTCGCCPLLFSPWSERAEHGEGWRPEPGRVFADSYTVSLDVGTGVVVEIVPDGGDVAAWSLDLSLLAVDADLDPVLDEGVRPPRS